MLYRPWGKIKAISRQSCIQTKQKYTCIDRQRGRKRKREENNKLTQRATNQHSIALKFIVKIIELKGKECIVLHNIVFQ